VQWVVKVLKCLPWVFVVSSEVRDITLLQKPYPVKSIFGEGIVQDNIIK
jgi:hypothetical protein